MKNKEKTLILLADVVSATISAQSTFQIAHNDAVVVWYDNEAKVINICAEEKGSCELTIDDADAILKITATSLKSAEYINKALGATIAGYEDENGEYHDSHQTVIDNEIERLVKHYHDREG